MLSFFGSFFFFFFNIALVNLQVHITQGDRDGRGVIISWVTPLSPKPKVVRYWAADCDEKHADELKARTTTYKYYNYTSGFIHHATIKKLKVRSLLVLVFESYAFS